ncbi:multimerin-2a isoform X2 [Anoplopoma fimbria]|uniref:multimerin-2a isoform X2 n=1 Tax=Anoplopoma fimbria TaxID=229290 RepID=UPI0023EBA4B0|nr:multimerin-2a isoform X2 [Anoplopoma fimbria]
MWRRADMTAVRELVLVLGLLVSAHCEVRARDPEVEEEEDHLGARGGGGGGGGGGVASAPHPQRLHPQRLHPRATVTTPPLGGTYAARNGYRQKQQVVTALQWRCCPGHRGHNCEETVPDAQLDSGSSALIGGSKDVKRELLAPAVQQQNGDPNSEQNDHQPYETGYHDDQDNTTPPAQDQDQDYNQKPHHTPHPTTDAYGHNPHHPHHADHTKHPHRPHHADHTNHSQQHQQNHHHLPVDGVDADALPNTKAPPTLNVTQMMALVMSQLQPVMEGFNRSLEHLSRQVGDLVRDVAELKGSQLEPELQSDSLVRPELDKAVEERLDAKLEDAFQHIREVRRQMESQRTDMEYRLHSQHAMMHYNLTSFKMDIDMKLKRHQKLLQVNLQAMNATLTDLKLDQDESTEEDHGPHLTLLPPDTSVLWEAVERLDNMVVNNTVKVDGLMEDVEVTSGEVQQLRRYLKDLEKHINHTARNSQIQFMETGLEVEAARETVLRRVDELARNLSQQGEHLREMDNDVDYLYETFYKHNSSTDCDCKGLTAAMARLERGVANVTELANENRLALDEENEAGAGQWGGAGNWEPAVETLQYGLQQVKESLASERNRAQTLDQSLNRLSSSVMVAVAEVSGLKETNREVLKERQHLSGSFTSLLTDAVRQSDVLELLLGEEVLEFLEWPVQDQEAHSIPSLKEQLRLLQEQLRGHDLSITSLLAKKPGGREEIPSADQPSSSSHPLSDDWQPGNMRRSSGGVPARERQLLLHPEVRHGGDGSDLWNLEKKVEELRLKMLRLEKKFNTSTENEAAPGDVEAKLQVEVIRLKRGLEEHLRVFKNVFSNADVLVGSDATLELDKLWQLVKNKDGKKEKKRGGGSGRGGNHRSRRETSGVAPVPTSLSGDSLLLVAGSPLSISNSVIVFEASPNRGQFYSDTGTFTAPLNGIYLFVLTLDLRPGPTHVVLRRGSGGAPVSLHLREVTAAGPVTDVGLLPLREGEEVRLELKGAVWAESEDNVFTILLLHRTN